MNRTPGRRPQRVAEAIREAVAEFLTAEARDPRIGLVTVTGVKVTADLKRAVVRVMAHGDEEAKERSRRALTHAAGAMRHAIGERLRLRTVPEVVFELDRESERASRIDALLAQLRAAGDEHA
ncbi:MAG TPA: 30S ribosome-binding factor RbfA [Gemmatimonadales bacterium]|nr:30S ribosome-binding factor RbfA [Gemmatimonadales bacterium]